MADQLGQSDSTVVPEEQSQVVSQDGAQPATFAGTTAPAEDPRDTRIAALELELRAMKGRLTTRVPDAELAGIKTEMLLMRRQLLEVRDMDESTRQAERAKLSAEEAAAIFVQRSTKMSTRIAGVLSEGGIGDDHPKVLEANQKWRAAQTIEEREDVEDDLTRFVISEMASKTKAEIEAERKKVQEAEQRFNQANGTLDVAVSGGTPAGARNVSKPTFDPRGGHIKQLKEWERQQAARVGT